MDDEVVTSVEFARCEMPFAESEWHFALGSSTVKRGFFVRLSSESGTHGYSYFGEIAHDGEIVEGALAVLRRITGQIQDRTPDEVVDFMAGSPGPFGHRRAKAALEVAALDLISRRSGRPPLAGRAPVASEGPVDVMRIVPLGTPAEVGAHSAALVAAGYRFLKLKASGDVALDAERVQQARAAAGPAVGLIVDANQSFRPKDAVVFADRIAEYRVDIFEQPVHRSDLHGLRYVRERTAMIVEADEGVATIEELLEHIRAGAIDGVSLKFPKMGGMLPTLEIARTAVAAGLTVRIGATFGSRMYAAENLHLQRHLPRHYAAELGEFEHLHDDPVSGLAVVNGQLVRPDGPGFGADLDPHSALEWESLSA